MIHEQWNMNLTNLIDVVKNIILERNISHYCSRVCMKVWSLFENDFSIHNVDLSNYNNFFICHMNFFEFQMVHWVSEFRKKNVGIFWVSKEECVKLLISASCLQHHES